MCSIGELLFNNLYFLFFGAAFLLFIAMVGAILLTLDNNKELMNKIYLNFIHLNINWKFKL